MNTRNATKKLLDALVLGYRRKGAGNQIREFHFTQREKVSAEIRRNYNYNGDLLDLFTTNKDNILHKWHHYIPLYDRYFSSFRGKDVKFLEIGVSKGGSLQLWRRYFGENAVLFGVDVDPACQKLDGQFAQVRIGSQTDNRFLESVVREMGGLDIVLDDGSHQMAHIRTSLECLFPHLGAGGLYMIEDLHAAYWREYGGGYSSSSNFFRYVDDLVDDMHHWYHKRKLKRPAVSENCAGIHIHDSMVIIEKRLVCRPAHSFIE